MEPQGGNGFPFSREGELTARAWVPGMFVLEVSCLPPYSGSASAECRTAAAAADAVRANVFGAGGGKPIRFLVVEL